MPIQGEVSYIQYYNIIDAQHFVVPYHQIYTYPPKHATNASLANMIINDYTPFYDFDANIAP